jgi:tetratricopeptide (TPR) repeat protein
MADGQEERALELGRQTLTMAEGLGLEDVFASVLVSIGVARTSLGDVGGLGDLARSLEFAERTGPAEVARSHFNLGSAYANLGELERAFGHYAKGAEAARKLGDPAVTLWFEAERLYERYWRGAWDEALEAAQQASAGWASFDAALVSAAVFRARGTVEQAEAEATRALAFAREAETAQALLPALASAARTAVERDDVATAAALLDELGREWTETQFIPGFWAADAAVAAAAAGRRGPFEQLLAGSTARTRWVDAACAYLAEDFVAVADTFAVIGSAPDEAFARLRAAESLVLAGRRADADVQLRAALGFHRGVGARRYVRAGEALLSASA